MRYFKPCLSFFILSLIVIRPALVKAENLQQVYRQAVNHDQVLKISLTTLQQVAETVPQAWSLVLPNVSLTGTASVTHHDTTTNGVAGDVSFPTLSTTDKTLQYSITLDQPLFDSSVYSGLRIANNRVKAQYAAFRAAQQDLITRTIEAYLQVLENKDLLTYAEAEERAVYEQYREIKARFQVGVSTITEVYQAKAVYDGSVAKHIAAKNALENAFEALSVITGKTYQVLMPLSEDFPLVAPSPSDIDQWVGFTHHNNATIRRYYYLVEAAKYEIRAQRGQHLPSLGMSLGYGRRVDHSITDAGNSTTREVTPQIALKLTIPVFQGGMITSKVREAVAAYEEAEADLEFNRRQQVENARKAYLAILSGISQVNADRKTILSDKRALDATVESYKVGTQTIVDVLDAEQQLYGDLSHYAINRYTYVQAIIQLKQAAGTLNSSDVIKLNSWMVDQPTHLF